MMCDCNDSLFYPEPSEAAGRDAAHRS